MPSLKSYLLPLLATLTITLTPTLVLGAFVPSALLPRHAESGINCDGSANCLGFKGELPNLLRKINKIATGTVYHAGDQLACSGFDTVDNSYGNTFAKGDGLCAMIGHNTPDFTVGASTNGQSNSAADVIADLIWLGCKACGTAPTVRQGNDLSKGSISVNYVSGVCYCTDDNPCGS